MPRIELARPELKMRLFKMKFHLATAAVAFLVLSASGNRSRAGDGAPPTGKTAAPRATDANSLSADSERELLKKICKAWREREERVRSLILIYVMNVTESAEQVRLQNLIAQRLKARTPRRGKDAPQIAKAAKPVAAVPNKYALLCFLAIKGDRYRFEYWCTKTEKEARALLPNLALGKDCDYAVIEEGDRRYHLNPKGQDSAGTTFRAIGITPRRDEIADTAAGELLLADYRSSMPALSRRIPLELASLTVVPQNGGTPASVIVSLERRELRLDPSRDYLITQITSYAQDGETRTSRTECEYQKAPAPLGWIPKKWKSDRWTEECTVIDWATGDEKVPKSLFEFDYPDGTEILDQSDEHTNKLSIAWHAKLVPVNIGRPYAESLERIKKGQPAAPTDKK
jgi:hypothetical protein